MLTLVGAFFSLEMDLLGTLVITTYAAVFILLGLLVTQFDLLTALACRGATLGWVGSGTLVLVWLVCQGGGQVSGGGAV